MRRRHSTGHTHKRDGLKILIETFLKSLQSVWSVISYSTKALNHALPIRLEWLQTHSLPMEAGRYNLFCPAPLFSSSLPSPPLLILFSTSCHSYLHPTPTLHSHAVLGRLVHLWSHTERFCAYGLYCHANNTQSNDLAVEECSRPWGKPLEFYAT